MEPIILSEKRQFTLSHIFFKTCKVVRTWSTVINVGWKTSTPLVLELKSGLLSDLSGKDELLYVAP